MLNLNRSFPGRLSLIFIFLSLANIGSLYAQDLFFFELKPKSPQAVPFTLSAVIDARLFTAHHGYVPNGQDGRLIPALFENGIEKEIAGYLEQQFEYTSKDYSIALVVREFHINECNQSRDFGQLMMLFDFYYTKGDQYLHLLRVDDLQETSGFNVKKSHCSNIAKSLQAAVDKLVQSNWLTKTKNSSKNWQSQTEVLAVPHAYSSLLKAPLKPGIYRSYVEFRANQPSITGVDIQFKKSAKEDLVEKRSVSFKGISKDVDSKNLSKEMWGFCDGENVYINNWPVFQNYSFSRLNSIGKYCPFIGKESLFRSGADRLAGSDVATKAYVFDIETGQSYLLDEAYFENILKSHTALHHKYRQERDKDNPITKIWYAKELCIALSTN